MSSFFCFKKKTAYELRISDWISDVCSSDLSAIAQPQLCCHITQTTPASHALIRENLHRAPLYSGQIESVGPRYCPSIEDKVVRFADRSQHKIFLEPAGPEDPTVYPNGLSTSNAEDIRVGKESVQKGKTRG